MRLFYLLNVVAFAANGLKLVLNFTCILVGRFIYGVCTGALNALLGKILNDCIPNEVYNHYQLATNCGLNLGIVTVAVVGALAVPMPEEGEEALQANEGWRIVTIYSMAAEILCLLLIRIFFPNPSLQDELKRGSSKADVIIRKIYKFEDESTLQEIKDQLISQQSTEEGSRNIGIIEALTDKRYRFANWNGVVIGFL